MSDDRHSPGPWQWWEERHVLFDANGMEVIIPALEREGGSIIFRNPYDARLIAAAPETKRERDEAVALLRKAVSRFVCFGGKEPPLSPCGTCWLCEMRALLARIDRK